MKRISLDIRNQYTYYADGQCHLSHTKGEDIDFYS
ncbi:unannotated protein [freshwater metagenome]|uniref:Unannotated protein n=1 Tax=freshwater metagenome TaxID=449393 RepID=A0A6J6A4P5_9ZZZZ